MQLNDLFEKFSSIKVLVVGDVMLDTYMWGNVDRISPEAPVPIVALRQKEYRIGGAGNVALNVAALGAQVSILSVIGKDEDGEQLKKLFNENNVDISLVVESNQRITTNKTRIICRNQQMLRLDAEIVDDINETLEAELLQKFKQLLKAARPDVVVFEDYNKGVLSENVISQFLQICKRENIITTVDPKKKNFLAYQYATIFKPNLKEVKEGLNISVDAIDEKTMLAIHKELAKHLQHEISVITLSEHGVFFGSEKQSAILPAHLRNIADVSGAGDTVIATLSLAYAATKDIRLSAEIANIAGGLVCEEVGTAPINKEKLFSECKMLIFK